MKSASYLKPGICGLMVLLSGIYFYLNEKKIGVFLSQFNGIIWGAPAPEARITVDGKTVWQKPLLSTGFFDASGKLQVHYITLKPALMQQLMQQDKDVRVVYGDDEPVRPHFTNQLQGIRADFPHQRIYLFSDDQIDNLATAAATELRGGQNNVECIPQSFCQAVAVTSREWGRVEGPFLGTDINQSRRGLPRGRWLKGPTTTFNVHSDAQRRVKMLFNVYALMPDQRITISGSGVRNVKQPEVPVDQMNIGVWDLYPRSYIVEMELHAGDNALVFEFSKWPKPVEGEYQLATYLSAIKIKPLH